MTKTISIPQFMSQFGAEDVCVQYLINKRWPEGIVCPFCLCKKIYCFADGIRFKCAKKGCRKHFNVATNTMFESTKIPIATWFLILFLSVHGKKNSSSVQVSRNVGITQKTAWHVMRKLRDLFYQDPNLVLSGTVEIDEAFLGGGSRWTRWGSLTTRKAPILGMVERGGKAIVYCIPDRCVDNLEPLISKHVEYGSTVYTDGWIGYRNLEKWYKHEYIDHGAKEWMRGNVHTNNVESLWNYIKAAIRYGHHSVSNDHVQKYCNEVVFRWNNRHLPTMEKFNELISRSFNMEIIEAKIIEMKVA